MLDITFHIFASQLWRHVTPSIIVTPSAAHQLGEWNTKSMWEDWGGGGGGGCFVYCGYDDSYYSILVMYLPKLSRVAALTLEQSCARPVQMKDIAKKKKIIAKRIRICLAVLSQIKYILFQRCTHHIPFLFHSRYTEWDSRTSKWDVRNSKRDLYRWEGIPGFPTWGFHECRLRHTRGGFSAWRWWQESPWNV